MALASEEIIAGRNPVEEALKAGLRANSILVEREAAGRYSAIIKAAKERGIPVKTVAREKLDRLAGAGKHQGIALFASPVEYLSIEELLALAGESDEPGLFVICDEIADPGNLGAIIRSADGAGASGVIIPDRRSCPVTGAVMKASAGAAAYAKIARVGNVVSAIDSLKERGVWVYAAEADGEDYTARDYTAPTAFVLGSEGHGVRRLVRERCDGVVSLPMKGGVTSLNVSVAAGILLYEAARQRAVAGMRAFDAGSPGGVA